MTAAPAPIVSVERIVKDFRPGLGLRRKRVLDGISFGVEQGEIFGFVGPNGAGKTTTLKILMGLIHPTSGRARVLGRDVRETEFRRYIGFLPENPSFYEFLTGREFLRFYAELSGLPRGASAARVEEVLRWVQIEPAADARLRTYSKGMLQRIGLAQALVNDPEVVFLDEPMSGLDPIGRKEIRDLILRLKQEGKTILMNTHILSDVELLCDRVAIIVGGRIRQEGSIESVVVRGEEERDVTLARLPPPLVARFEESFGLRMTGQGDRIELRVPEKRLEELLRAALEAGARVVSVSPHRVSLESILVSVVEQEDAP